MRHSDSELGAVIVVVGLETVIVELVDRASRISTQFAKIGRVVLIHFLGKADVIIAANAAALVLAEQDRPLVLADHLVVLAEA
jgi:hypothetical protein